jgi:hypothetical protein
MVDAGFIYLQSSDQTLTFCCNTYVRDWRETDDPYQKHAELAKGECRFLTDAIGAEAVKTYKDEVSTTTTVVEVSTATATATVDDMCCKCDKQEIQAAISPCGHGMCNDCAYDDKFRCGLCRARIYNIVKIFK